MDVAGNQGICERREKMKVKPFTTFLNMKFWVEYEDLMLCHIADEMPYRP